MTAAVVLIEQGGVGRRVALFDYLDGAATELAATSAHAWIKDLRHAVVDGAPMRRRFTYRGDSLWWFTELYLHKTQTVEKLFRVILAVEQLLDRERPEAIGIVSGDRLVRGVVPQIARIRGVRCRGTRGFGAARLRIARLHGRARSLTWAALASRLKPRATTGVQRGRLTAFIHSAFWTADGADGSAEAYIGPVLAAIEQQSGAVNYVGVGPTENFAARRWWRTLAAPKTLGTVVPIEGFAPLSALEGSRGIWRQRRSLLRALWRSEDLRRRAAIRDCDCWPVVREELAGVALLQWPWSARAMDEAGAALDALKPPVVLTYAEAGGWGRALMLECRRRRIPSAGLQHGFIYRHWLNYLHEPDEMEPDTVNTADAGFPRPTVTLLFDRYAAEHLETAGHFPAGSLAVTGSARLERLLDAASKVAVDSGEPFLLVVTKFKEARGILPALIDATATLTGVRLVIKAHPAETPDVYAAMTDGHPFVRVLPASTPLAPLLRNCRAVVTVNSTVALDAAVLDVPALVIGLPNNLSPFVAAGVLAGAQTPGEIGPMLRKILYDQEFRELLEDVRTAFLRSYQMIPDGRAAERSAAAVLALPKGTL